MSFPAANDSIKLGMPKADLRLPHYAYFTPYEARLSGA